MDKLIQLQIERYDLALSEAHRFISKAKKAKLEVSKFSGSCLHNAAAKRASMDLTRALAQLRKSLYV
jgi:hypothetical protein